MSFEWELEDGSIIIDEPQIVPISGHFSGTVDANGLDFQFVDYAPSIPILGGLAETGDWMVYSVGCALHVIFAVFCRLIGSGIRLLVNVR